MRWFLCPFHLVFPLFIWQVYMESEWSHRFWDKRYPVCNPVSLLGEDNRGILMGPVLLLRKSGRGWETPKMEKWGFKVRYTQAIVWERCKQGCEGGEGWDSKMFPPVRISAGFTPRKELTPVTSLLFFHSNETYFFPIKIYSLKFHPFLASDQMHPKSQCKKNGALGYKIKYLHVCFPSCL